MFRKILFPVDFSERCDGAARFVERYAQQFGSEVTMLHVVDIPDYLFGTPEYTPIPFTEIRNEQISQRMTKLDHYLLDRFGEVKVNRVIVEGEPGREIVRYAHEHMFDLIMMPSHGFGPFRRFVIGSVTAKVLHDAHCPVWTDVHAEEPLADDMIGVHRITCGIDLGPTTESTVEFAADLSKAVNGPVWLAHAIPTIEVRPMSYFDVDFNAHVSEEARARIEQMQERLGTKFPICIHGGEPGDVVRESALTHRADTVVIARGKVTGGLGRLRTHSYAIINKSPCPVISV
jgi:nucleotide-binding universal stress UspA family protein